MEIDLFRLYLNETEPYSYLTNLPDEIGYELADRARHGDQEARDLLILSCLHYVVHIALSYFADGKAPHDDLLDLVSVGHVELVETFDHALTKENPRRYLCMRAKYAIMKYCHYRSGLIARPQNLEPKTVASLDVLKEKRFEPRTPEEERNAEASNDTELQPLYEALDQLTELQREVIVRHYGLFGQPEEKFADIHPSLEVAVNRHRLAIRSLRKKLTGLM